MNHKEINNKCKELNLPMIFDDTNNLTEYGCNVLLGIGIAVALEGFKKIFKIIEKEIENE